MKIIRTNKEYQEALERAEKLISLDPALGTETAEELELLTLLINRFEEERFPVSIPDPIEAIKFRMEQRGLNLTDMVPYFGSKSKASEVLNRKRSLSLSMIRLLNQGLGIPAEILIADIGKSIPNDAEGIDWGRFPLGEMVKKGWIHFDGSINSAREKAEELLSEFFTEANLREVPKAVLYRKTVRSDSPVNEYALTAWYAKARIEQGKMQVEKKHNKEDLSGCFFDDLRKLSFLDKGPLLAREFLLKSGIKMVVVPHFKGTRLDGAVFRNERGEPVIALSLRFDRLDNFWFTLFHELSHLRLHLSSPEDRFFDDLGTTGVISEVEREADIFAQDSLISQQEWSSFYKTNIKEQDILDFAQKLRISPSIVAGRIQKEHGDFSLFRGLLGQKKVRALFDLE